MQKTEEKRRLFRRLGLYALLVLAAAALLLTLLGAHARKSRQAPETASAETETPAPPTERLQAMQDAPETEEPEPETKQTEQTEPETEQPAPLPAGYREEYVLPPLSDGTLVLVNRAFGFDPDGVETVSINDLRSIHYGVRSTELGLRPEVIEALNAWLDDFFDQSGIWEVTVVAAHRSFAEQQQLYDRAVQNNGQAYADCYLALPGHSEHHTGLVLDLDTYFPETNESGGFSGTGAYQWAADHAWEYGFVLRYPADKTDLTGIAYESWHYRYVGLPHSYLMAADGLCLEEYIDRLRRCPFDGEHLTVECLGTAYELYFCPAGRLVVPTDRAFTVSGNNVDGYIVTIVGS